MISKYEYNKKWRAKNRVKVRRNSELYRKRHPEKILRYNNEWRKRNPEKSQKHQKNQYVKFAEWFRELKSGPCMDCGGRFPVVCMDWDHREPESKKYSVGRMKGLNRELILEEIAKCDLVCSNCHRIRTQLRKDWWDLV